MAAVSIDRNNTVRTSTWRTGNYIVMHNLEYTSNPGYQAGIDLCGAIKQGLHLVHMGGDNWAMRELAPSAGTRNWATSGSRRGLDNVQTQWTNINSAASAAGAGAPGYILVAHNYGTWCSGTTGEGRPRNTTDATNFGILTAEVITREGNYTHAAYGQEQKGGYSRSNATEFNSHYNAWANALKAVHPSVVKMGPHRNLFAGSNGGADPYSNREANMAAMLAGGNFGDTTTGDQTWLTSFITNCWANIDVLALDISMVDYGDTIANGRVGNWAHLRTKTKILQEAQRAAEDIMMAVHGTVKPIYWIEYYMDVDLQQADSYNEDVQAVGHLLMDLYAALGTGCVNGCYGTNRWNAEGDQAVPYNRYCWFSDIGSTTDRPAGTAYKLYTYTKEAVDRFVNGKQFVACTSDTSTIHPFCNAQGEYMIFNTDTSDVITAVTDTASGITKTFTVPATGRVTGTLPFPSGGGLIAPVQDWKTNYVTGATSVAVAAGQGWATPTTGHLLVACVESNQNVSNVTHAMGPGVWSTAVDQPGGAGAAGTRAPHVTIFYKISDGTESTITATLGASVRGALQVIELAGAINPAATDGTSSVTSDTATASTFGAGSLTTATDGSYVVAAIGTENNHAISIAGGSGYDQNTVVSNESGATSVNRLSVGLFDKGQNPIGISTLAPTGTLTVQYSGVQAAFKPAATVGPTITGPNFIGGASPSVNTNPIVINVGASGVPSGSLIFIGSTSHFNSLTLSSVADSKGNTYTVTSTVTVGTVVYGNSAYCRTTTALVNGDTISLTMTGATSGGAYSAHYFQNASGTPRTPTGVTNTGTNSPISLGSSTPIATGDLLVGSTYMRASATGPATDTGFTATTGTEGTEVCRGTATNRATGLVSIVAPSTSPITMGGTATALGGEWGTRTLIFPAQAALTPPASSVAPDVTGSTGTGNALSCTTGSWTNTPTAYAYQWQRNGGNISGANTSTYSIQAGDAGSNIVCVVTASNADGSASALSNTTAIPSGPANSVVPAVSGLTTLGATLTTTNGTWSGSPAFTYQWLRNDVVIGGATASTYVLTLADSAAVIKSRVSGSNANGSASATSTGTTAGTFSAGGANRNNYSFFEVW